MLCYLSKQNDFVFREGCDRQHEVFILFVLHCCPYLLTVTHINYELLLNVGVVLVNVTYVS